MNLKTATIGALGRVVDLPNPTQRASHRQSHSETAPDRRRRVSRSWRARAAGIGPPRPGELDELVPKLRRVRRPRLGHREHLQITRSRIHETASTPASPTSTGKDGSDRTLTNVAGWNVEFEYDHCKPEGARRKEMNVSKVTTLGWKASTSLDEGFRTAYGWSSVNVAGRAPLPLAAT